MRKWVELAALCEKAMEPDRKIDAAMAKALGLVPSGLTPGTSRGYEARFSNSTVWIWDAPYYTASLNAITALIERELPGWAWKVGTCSVSDDAWLTPDFNCPMHGDRLKRELGYDRMKPGDLLDVGIDIELRPSGRAALALCAAFCRAMNEKEANA